MKISRTRIVLTMFFVLWYCGGRHWRKSIDDKLASRLDQVLVTQLHTCPNVGKKWWPPLPVAEPWAPTLPWPKWPWSWWPAPWMWWPMMSPPCSWLFGREFPPIDEAAVRLDLESLRIASSAFSASSSSSSKEDDRFRLTFPSRIPVGFDSIGDPSCVW